MTKSADDDLRKIAQHLTPKSGGKGRHSPLFRWLFERASAFEQLLTEQQPSWESAAEAFKRLGVKDGTAKDPSAACVRQTWIKVKRAKGWLRKPVAAEAQPAPIPPPAPALIFPAPAAARSTGPPDEEVDFEFRTLSRPPKRG